MDLTHEYTHDISRRFKHLSWIIALVLLVIVAKLYYLQIIKGSYYHFFSEQNSIKEMKIPALRGTIYDRNGKVLVDNRPAFDAVVVPQYIHDKAKVIDTLSILLNLDKAAIEEKLNKAKSMPSYYPVVIKSDINEDEVAALKAHKTPWYDDADKFDLRGVDIDLRYARVYPDTFASSHLLGYLREIDENKLKSYNETYDNIYRLGDFVGIGGVEEMWDFAIRGRDGFDQKVVNATGREVIWPDIELIREQPVNGASLNLTVDATLQEIARKEFEGKSGAVVALDPKTGEVLALYSAPSMDLNKLSSPEGNRYWGQLSTDASKPLYNRFLQGTYPPASTYKITTSTAGLGEKEITETSKLFCGGGLTFGGRLYKCWRASGHGSIGVVEAITSSCDTFFYQLGLKLGVDKIAKYANALGLGHITGIDLPREKSGLIPTSQWKMERYKTPWQAGENISIAIGQGYDTVTPLQNALMIATIANDGKRVVPHVTRSIINADGHTIYEHQNIEGEQTVPKEVADVVKKGLEGVVNSPGGTGHRLSALKLKIAGKTGTAQVISREQWKSGVEKLKDHAWFVGYAPYDDPQIAVAVIVENGGFGASAAAPVVGKIIEQYLGSK